MAKYNQEKLVEELKQALKIMSYHVPRPEKKRGDFHNPIKAHGRSIKLYVNYAEKNDYKKTTKIYKVLGCTQQELLQHLEKQFLKGMNWKNRKLWHIDHIIPMDTAKTLEDNYKLNHFTNLRPMWAKDNLSKKNNITHLI
jgi:hypothetical protein